ncbi:hypothetical protein HF324_29145 [Chitinophaga oryzae]|uniref:Uncharacterized protein n=1 Tax=Chitinophaga oryzae TaxID=2725414 RepID=A0ABX6LP62_9BACT|nr:hypothetical protein [Chitinophaga oryzae]QJB41693.1 hypothetical protein HF324_29145 [Chitinophaga oryzae]
MEKLQREVRLLKAYSLILTTVLVAFFFMAFRTDFGKQRFQEIDVERINVVEKDGTLKMVIANGERQHPGMAEGKELAPRKRQPGLIFFNSAGDECGGLVYDADKKDGAGMVYSVDQYRNDQIMQLQYMQDLEGSKARTYGLKIWDRPDDFTLTRQNQVHDSLTALKDEKVYNEVMKQLVSEGKYGTERLFVGRTWKDEVGLFIRDSKGKVRIKIYVDKQNQTKIETFDEQGKPVTK